MWDLDNSTWPSKEPAISFTLVMSTFILTMLSLGGCSLTFGLILYCAFVSTVLTIAGELSLQAFHLTSIKAWLPTAFVVGFAVVSTLMLALNLIFNLSALTAFLICTLFVFCLKFTVSTRPIAYISNAWHGSVIVFFFALIIVGFAKTPILSSTILNNTGVLPIWSDYYLHGITIASFGSPFANGGDLEMAGISRFLYHYTSFVIPASFQTISGMSGLALATSLHLPLGLLIAALGSYSFAVELGGRLSGLLAVLVIICLPVYSVISQSGWFDFFWLIFISPGSGYAIGVSAVICTSTLIYLKNNDSRIIALILLLLLLNIFVRAHMFLLLAPTIVILVFQHRWSVNIRLLMTSVIGSILLGILALYFSPYLYALWMEHGKPHEYLNSALQWSPMYGQTFQFLGLPFHLTLPAQIIYILAAILGGYLILYPMMLWLYYKRFGFHSIDALPLLLLLTFIGLMLFAPSSWVGDLSDYKHRHFPLLYVVVAIYTVTYAFSLISTRISDQNKKLSYWVYSLVIGVFAISIALNWNSNPARPNIEAMPWASIYHNEPITPGLLESAQYLSSHAKHGDVFAMGVVAASVTYPNNPVDNIISLTGMPAYIARTEMRMKWAGCVKENVVQRLSVLQSLSAINNWPDAQKFLHSKGIRWFLSLPGEKKNWDIDRKYAVFSSNGVSIYDAGHSETDSFKKIQC
jgi:hypothetical protein